MFQRLRHHAVVGGHDENREVDSTHARQHVADEPLVSGNVDEPENGPVAKGQIREAEVDRNAARLLFGQPVGVDSGERAYQRRLAMIDMARGGDDHRDPDSYSHSMVAGGLLEIS